MCIEYISSSAYPSLRSQPSFDMSVKSPEAFVCRRRRDFSHSMSRMNAWLRAWRSRAECAHHPPDHRRQVQQRTGGSHRGAGRPRGGLLRHSRRHHPPKPLLQSRGDETRFLQAAPDPVEECVDPPQHVAGHLRAHLHPGRQEAQDQRDVLVDAVALAGPQVDGRVVAVDEDRALPAEERAARPSTTTGRSRPARRLGRRGRIASGSSSRRARKAIRSSEKRMSMFVASTNVPRARRMPTFLPIIWKSGSRSACSSRMCSSCGTSTIRTSHQPSLSGHSSTSASRGRSAGGFHSTSTSSAGRRCRSHCAISPFTNSCIR